MLLWSGRLTGRKAGRRKSLEFSKSCNLASNAIFSMFEYILRIDNAVPIDIWLELERSILQGCFLVCFGSHSFPCQSLLLSTTVLTDT